MTWQGWSSGSRRRPCRSTLREPPDSGERRHHPGLLPGTQHHLRLAAGVVDPGDLGANPSGRGRGLPAPDAERRPAADHDPRPGLQRERHYRGERHGDSHARISDLRSRCRERRLEGRHPGATAARVRPVRSAAHVPRDDFDPGAARRVPVAHPHPAAGHRQGERRQGGFAQCRHQRQPLPPRHRRGRRHAHRARCAAPAHASIPPRPADRRSRRDRARRQQLHRPGRPRDRRPCPSSLPPRHPSGRVPARLPVRPPRLEPPRR